MNRVEKLPRRGALAGVDARERCQPCFYSQFQGAAEFKQNASPLGTLDFIGVADMLSPAGYLQATVFSRVGPLVLIMGAITLTARTVARLDGGGGMDLLLANPMS